MTTTSPTTVTTPPTDAATDDATDAATASRAAGVAAIVVAGTYLVGLGVFGAWLGPAGYAADSAGEQLDLVRRHGGALLAVDALLYLVGGAAMVVLAVGLHQRLRPAPWMLRTSAAAFGVVWAGLLLAAGSVIIVGQQAAVDLHATDPEGAVTVWTAVRTVHDGLGGGIEVVGALWVALVAVAGLRHRALPRGAGRLGLVAAAAGLLTVVPALEPFTAVFGLGMLVWFGWVGWACARRRTPSPADR